jgi:hypothetical protein
MNRLVDLKKVLSFLFLIALIDKNLLSDYVSIGRSLLYVNNNIQTGHWHNISLELRVKTKNPCYPEEIFLTLRVSL